MQLERYVNTLGRHLKARFGERVRKLSLHADFTCPNRDGTLGRGGCTFCSVLSFNPTQPQTPIDEQLAAAKAETKRASRYLVYFQAYTSTYAEVEQLRRLYAQATARSDIVGLCVGTRPDCLPDSVLALLADYRQRGYEVWLERRSGVTRRGRRSTPSAPTWRKTAARAAALAPRPTRATQLPA